MYFRKFSVKKTVQSSDTELLRISNEQILCGERTFLESEAITNIQFPTRDIHKNALKELNWSFCTFQYQGEDVDFYFRQNFSTFESPILNVNFPNSYESVKQLITKNYVQYPLKSNSDKPNFHVWVQHQDPLYFMDIKIDDLSDEAVAKDMLRDNFRILDQDLRQAIAGKWVFIWYKLVKNPFLQPNKREPISSILLYYDGELALNTDGYEQLSPFISDKDKKLFMAVSRSSNVPPLQSFVIMMNEESRTQHNLFLPTFDRFPDPTLPSSKKSFHLSLGFVRFPPRSPYISKFANWETAWQNLQQGYIPVEETSATLSFTQRIYVEKPQNFDMRFINSIVFGPTNQQPKSSLKNYSSCKLDSDTLVFYRTEKLDSLYGRYHIPIQDFERTSNSSDNLDKYLMNDYQLIYRNVKNLYWLKKGTHLPIVDVAISENDAQEEILLQKGFTKITVNLAPQSSFKEQYLWYQQCLSPLAPLTDIQITYSDNNLPSYELKYTSNSINMWCSRDPKYGEVIQRLHISSKEDISSALLKAGYRKHSVQLNTAGSQNISLFDIKKAPPYKYEDGQIIFLYEPLTSSVLTSSINLRSLQINDLKESRWFFALFNFPVGGPQTGCTCVRAVKKGETLSSKEFYWKFDPKTCEIQLDDNFNPEDKNFAFRFYHTNANLLEIRDFENHKIELKISVKPKDQTWMESLNKIYPILYEHTLKHTKYQVEQSSTPKLPGTLRSLALAFTLEKQFGHSTSFILNSDQALKSHNLNLDFLGSEREILVIMKSSKLSLAFSIAPWVIIKDLKSPFWKISDPKSWYYPVPEDLFSVIPTKDKKLLSTMFNNIACFTESDFCKVKCFHNFYLQIGLERNGLLNIELQSFLTDYYPRHYAKLDKYYWNITQRWNNLLDLIRKANLALVRKTPELVESNGIFCMIFAENLWRFGLFERCDFLISRNEKPLIPFSYGVDDWRAISANSSNIPMLPGN